MNLIRRKISWLYVFFLVMIAAAFMVPADGNHGVLSIKGLSILCCISGTLWYVFIKQRMTIYHVQLLLFFMLVLLLLMIWMVIGLWYDRTPLAAQIDQFKIFILTFSIPLMTLYLINERIISTSFVYTSVILANFAYVVLKIVFVSLHLLGIIDLWSILETLEIRYMRMSIYGGLERIQTSMDIATPFIIFFVLQSHPLRVRLSKGFKTIYLAASLLSTFLSFSRYLIFVYVISCFLYWFTLTPRRSLQIAVAMFSLATAAYTIMGQEAVAKIVERRIFSRDNYHSDEVRLAQIEALLNEFKNHPWLGNGIGSYAHENIRDKHVLHLYEVQWVAFLMQFGIIGLTLLLIPIAIIAVRLVFPICSRVNVSFLALFMVWILSGFTNPFLISLTSGIIYTLFYLKGSEHKFKG